MMKQSYFSRFTMIGGALSLASLFILFWMVRIQTSDSAKLIQQNAQAYTYTRKTVYPERGNIYDRWGSLLAGNTKIYEIGVARNELSGQKNRETIARAAEEILNLKYAEVLDLLEKTQEDDGLSYITLGSSFTPDQVNKLIELDKQYEAMPLPRGKNEVNPSLQGMHWVASLRRKYPEGTIGSNILGFYYYGGDANDKGGILGVEQRYERLLAGTPREVTMAMNPNEVETPPEVPPGASIVLTIDRELQASTEKILDNAVESSGSKGGTIVIMDPRNGEILTMATTPRLDPNNYADYDKIFPEGTPLNPAVSLPYEPGSVFKVLTMASAMDAGTVTPDTEFLDTGVFMAGGLPIYNWDRGAWGPQTMLGCMQHSLNVCLSWVATELGPTKFYSYLKAFGIDHRTNIDLADERLWPLYLPGDSFWTPLSLATNSFGQGLAATPIQMVTAIASLANDGKMMAPHVLKSYVQDGKQYDFDPIVLGTPVKAETARTLTEMLAVSLEEEASDALVPGYRVAGKIGTAEISQGEAGYTTNLTNASFVGWGPVDDPRFIVYIWLQEPTSSPWGSVVAAPVFSEVTQNLVKYLDLPPDDVRHQLFNE
jgi:cell division protein FtsI/penicillin-binding protein 2